MCIPVHKIVSKRKSYKQTHTYANIYMYICARMCVNVLCMCACVRFGCVYVCMVVCASACARVCCEDMLYSGLRTHPSYPAHRKVFCPFFHIQMRKPKHTYVHVYVFSASNEISVVKPRDFTARICEWNYRAHIAKLLPTCTRVS